MIQRTGSTVKKTLPAVSIICLVNIIKSVAEYFSFPIDEGTIWTAVTGGIGAITALLNLIKKRSPAATDRRKSNA